MIVVWAIIALCIILYLTPKANKQVQIDNVYSQNFEISPDSKQMFNKMKRDYLSNEEIKKFVIMEDRFLEYEKDSVCMGRDRQMEATSLDQAIRENFLGFDFTYHNKHLKQISEPNRIINPYLKCFNMT